jgi:hypothetical protein
VSKGERSGAKAARRKKSGNQKSGNQKSGNQKSGNHKSGNHKSGNQASDAQVRPTQTGAVPSSTRGAEPGHRRPPGQRLWDMPYSAVAPRMINPAIGLHNLVARAGHNAGYDIDLTLLDAPDHRMIRSGVLLAHRVLDGRGEWYLGAPDWVPLLPKERIEPMGQGDLPQALADLIRPFRRRAPLGPVAAIGCERREFALRDDHGVTMALLRDDKVTVRRGGLTTARYREVMMTPIGPGLSDEQDFWLSQVLGMAGATRVERFPRLVNRLGAPANGLTDYPMPALGDGSTRFGVFVASLLGRRLHQLLEADLALQADRPNAADELARTARILRQEICTVAPALEPHWISDLDEELGWLAAEADDATVGDDPLKAKLRSERYLALLERLVSASRASRTGESRTRPTNEVLEGMLDRAWRSLGKAADRFSHEPSIEAWADARSKLDTLLGLCDLIEQAEPGRFDQLRPRLAATSELLAEAGRRATTVQLTRARAEEVSPLEAFELGRRYEQELAEARTAREAFSAGWTRAAKKLDPLRSGREKSPGA